MYIHHHSEGMWTIETLLGFLQAPSRIEPSVERKVPGVWV